MLKLLKRGIQCCWFYFWGHLFSLFYNRKYITGRWFTGKMHGLSALGWRWVTCDALNRLKDGLNYSAAYPVGAGCRIVCPENIVFDPDDLNNFHSFGNYYQAIGTIEIGKGTYIAPNVGLITANHDLTNPDLHLPPRPVILGKQCWIGMNSVILPGVTLGDHTVVGAGSVVTKSFEEGFCVIAGNPAKLIRRLPNNDFENKGDKKE